MALRAQCPRCKQPLAVPNKLAGSYVNCPRCQGRFWVSKDSPVDPSINDSVSLPSGSTLTLAQAAATAAPAASPPLAVPPTRPLPLPAAPGPGPLPGSVSASGAVSAAAQSQAPSPRKSFHSLSPLPSATPPAAATAPLPPVNGPRPAPSSSQPTAPPQARKVARLVSAEAAQSTLKMAADGQLPFLQLQESDKNVRGQGKSRSVPPFVMILAWIASVVVTAAIFVLTSSSDPEGATTPEKEKATAAIERDFFGNPARGELLPYQKFLREARQARARGDFKAERQYYKKVLDLLHTETWGGPATADSRSRLQKGITGSRDHDRDLEKYILTVLGD